MSTTVQTAPAQGAKAHGLEQLRSRYGTLVPEFVVLPFAELVADWPAVRDAAETLIAGYLAGAVDDAEYDARATGLAAGLVLGDIPNSQWPAVSVRTSALAEDGIADSFAGQYLTTLDCAPADVPEAVRASVASLFSRAVVSYARSKRMTRLDIGGSVVIQRMFHGTRTGVLFSENGRAEIELAFSEGPRNTTVDGEDAESLVVSKLSALPTKLPVQTRLLEIALELEAQHGRPVDVEWAARGTELALLQVRPQTVAQLNYDLAWDCSNIAENYPGVTLPLSYSFIRGLYSRVYPNFFRLLGVSEKQIADHAHVFQNTLGYLDGHVYYQIDNWYEMVKLIPGSSHNQSFFAAMLQPARDGAPRVTPKPGLRGGIILAALGIRLGLLMTRADARSRRFKKTFAERLARYDALDWRSLRADAMLTTLERIRTDLLSLWATPILNDLRVMVFHGLLKTWCFGPERHADYLAYLRGLTDRASIAPLRALATLGERLREADGTSVADVLASPESVALVQEYLREFGDRTPDELQLENPRLGENLYSIVTLALGTSPSRAEPAAAPAVGNLRFGTAFIGRETRKAIDWRERFRFNRAQVYGLARSLYVALGERLVADDVVDDAADVFWLTEQELDAAVFGHSWDSDLRATVARRRGEYDAYENADLARRMVGSGLVAPRHLSSDVPASASGELAGMGVAPGVLTGEVLVVDAFDPAIDVRGKILVTSHIDPGWTLLFVQAAGVITERGNALSHVAIIARELGMPAVVAAVGATARLVSGQTVTMNGTTGAIDAE
ncbi:pyruvate,water dikinase [Conyzicola lurida]|uniref:Pyruvate,water dikinase n=1 Tax=Conyzicola lurida TaxID=1172621 RepID=A0A841AHF2_9MICO|nr:PEP/pyruvate-binding domain-containing protein [Conyzicola lurida]MBB5841844.1 pyruvate,water dikinase [Conyzicola lurida]